MIAYVVHFMIIGYFALIAALILDIHPVFYFVTGVTMGSSLVGWIVGFTPFLQSKAIEYTKKIEGLRKPFPREKRLIIHAAQPVFKKANYPLEKIKFMVSDSGSPMTVGKRVIAIPENELKNLNSGIIAHELGHIVFGHSTRTSCRVGACWSYYIFRNLLENKRIREIIIFFESLDAFRKRKEETKADLYTAKLGYGEELIDSLIVGCEIKPRYDWMRTHPTVEKRVIRIRQEQTKMCKTL